MDYEIENNIKLPRAYYGLHTKYPFGKMKLWDSFDAGEYSKKLQMRMGAAWHAWKLHNPIALKEDWKFATRKVEDRLRIWRIK